MIEKNAFVQIYKTILRPNERAKNIPNDTRSIPMEMRVKGFLLTRAKVGDIVQIQTATGRIEEGILLVVEPYFTHNFGHHVKAIDRIRQIIKHETEDL